MIREDIPGYMANLRAWLEETKNETLEEMTVFFRTRLDGYEAHMSPWQEAYRTLARMLPANTRTLLDLGCGTGLELDEIFRTHPAIEAIGIDLSQEMLGRLSQKHPRVETLCADYFDCDFGRERFDAAVSFETLHHFTPEKKAALFSKINRALKRGGLYLQAEYVACCAEEETLLREVFEQKRARDGIPAGSFVHFDVPLTLERELALLRGAGFADVHSPCCINGACFLSARKAD